MMGPVAGVLADTASASTDGEADPKSSVDVEGVGASVLGVGPLLGEVLGGLEEGGAVGPFVGELEG